MDSLKLGFTIAELSSSKEKKKKNKKKLNVRGIIRRRLTGSKHYVTRWVNGKENVKRLGQLQKTSNSAACVLGNVAVAAVLTIATQ